MNNDQSFSHLLKIIPISALRDNYIWLIHSAFDAIVIDPGDAVPVIAILSTLNLNLKAILVTHHHSDHIDGVSSLQVAFPEAKTFAPKHEHYDFSHTPVAEKMHVEIRMQVLSSNSQHAIFLPLTIQVIDLPGHTLGHIAYLTQLDLQSVLFCGDTLFGAGCGRLFEGSPAQMLSSLKKLGQLPVNTAVYCTHEYTLTNIQFALTLEPDNHALIQREQMTKITLKEGKPSLPSSIGLELATNPYLRCQQPTIKQSVQLDNASELSVFTKIRELRNHY